MKTLHIADLFCGAGGTSAGACAAAEELGYKPQLTAINHWDVAIATHAENHPNARHLCTGVDSVNPRDLYKPDELSMLWASPECTHHSVARGGRPIHEQSRATAWCVVRWADALRPPVILIENVPEFITWGPLDSKQRPIEKRKGELFHAWKAAIEAIGYRVDWRVLCAADFGDPTTRKRLFVQCVRGRRKIVWPEPTHAQLPEDDFLSRRKKWRAAREIIDWDIDAPSIYDRARPLSPKTMARIYAGLNKYGLKSFVMSAGGPECPARPTLGTVLTRDHRALVEPFVIPRTHSVDEPLPTITAQGRLNLVQPMLQPQLAQPFLVKMRGTSAAQIQNHSAASVDAPMPTVTAGGGHVALAEPFLVAIDHGSSPTPVASVDSPLSTITTKARHCVAQPFLVQVAHGNGSDPKGNERRSRSIDDPLNTVCGNRGEMALCEPHLLPQQSGGALRSVDQPAPTVATDGAIGLVEPYLIKFYGTALAQSVDDPLGTVTTKERHALVRQEVVIEGERYLLDIRFRMLQPHELAQAQGFPADYKFTGNKTEQVKQIGNAVPCNLARALVKAVLSQ